MRIATSIRVARLASDRDHDNEEEGDGQQDQEENVAEVVYVGEGGNTASRLIDGKFEDNAEYSRP